LAVSFKIETIPCADRLIIRLIGELNAECLPELEAQIRSDGRSIELEMDEVTLVDVDVVRFLISCRVRAIQLRGCSPYIREWIRREQESE
jgi:anti-anti-sigma regulatory factor